MTLPTSGVITFNEIVTEFGGTYPAYLTQYYRGGALVPNTSTNANIPTSGTISLTNFYGASAQIPFHTTISMVAGVNSPNQVAGYIPYPTLFGYSFAAIGSASPTTYQGYEVLGIYLYGGGSNFVVALNYTTTYPPQNIFTKIAFTDNTGTARSYLSANATFSSFNSGTYGKYSTWSWAASNTLYFTSGATYPLAFT